ncbi:hypothetical protein ACKWTF_013567 [Chironomus riparius]
MIVTLVRNKAHTLPLFLTYLEEQKYPKDRISLYFVTDHNIDNSREILEVWLTKVQSLYHSIHYQYDESKKLRKGETNVTHWPDERFKDLIKLKENALEYARQSWADYVFFLDADALLTTDDTLDVLISLNKAVVAPMLVSEGLYSNFWCGMSSDYYYRRTDDYKKIRNHELVGEHIVPMVHSAVLIDLKRTRSDFLTFNATNLNNFYSDKFFDGPIDDIIIFAISAKYSRTEMVISNTKFYGYILVPLDQDDLLDKDYEQIMNTKVAIVHRYDEIRVLPELKSYVKYPPMTRLTFSEIFMINLKRRPERKLKMDLTLKELGIEYTHFEAVDGKKLTDEEIAAKGIILMPEYEDPYHKRPMKLGEIGCFLSHYMIWQKMVENNLQEVLILEDDIKFEPYFREHAIQMMEEARRIGGYDLIYFGRKRLDDNEQYIDQSTNFVKVSYTYWTLAYAITLEGAKKLLAAEPLKRLLPVDEFLPIMFDQHPNDTWKFNYENRNVVAWSVQPLILYPTHYTGEEGYISDTEDSKQIEVDLLADKSLKNMKENIMHHAQHGHDGSEL